MKNNVELCTEFWFCTIACLGVKASLFEALDWVMGVNRVLSASWDAMVNCCFGWLFRIGISR